MWSADRTLGILVHFIQASLMEGMLAEEVHSWEIQRPPAGHAPASLEHDWFASQLLEFLFLVLCFSTVARYQAAILKYD